MKGCWVSIEERLPEYDPVYGQSECVLGACKINGKWVYEVERFSFLHPNSINPTVPFWGGVDMQFPQYWHPLTKPRKKKNGRS